MFNALKSSTFGFGIEFSVALFFLPSLGCCWKMRQLYCIFEQVRMLPSVVVFLSVTLVLSSHVMAGRIVVVERICQSLLQNPLSRDASQKRLGLHCMNGQRNLADNQWAACLTHECLDPWNIFKLVVLLLFRFADSSCRQDVLLQDVEDIIPNLEANLQLGLWRWKRSSALGIQLWLLKFCFFKKNPRLGFRRFPPKSREKVGSSHFKRRFLPRKMRKGPS